jgi:hypothetical protein
LHVANDVRCLEIVETAVKDLGVPGAMVVLTHVNWNGEILERSCEIARELGVNLDVTAVIRPDYFDGVVDPAQALTWLWKKLGSASQVTMSSDAGGNHPAGMAVIPHRPMVLLDAFRAALASSSAPTSELVAAATVNPRSRLGLDPAEVAVGHPADLLILPKDPGRPVTMLLGGLPAVTGGVAVRQDPMTA